MAEMYKKIKERCLLEAGKLSRTHIKNINCLINVNMNAINQTSRITHKCQRCPDTKCQRCPDTKVSTMS